MSTDQKRKDIADEAVDGAQEKSKHLCGTYVREAVQRALNISLTPIPSAKDHGPMYERNGFKHVKSYSGTKNNSAVRESDLEVGDILIFDAYEGHTDGHAEVYTGRSGKGKYCSDFKQATAYPWVGHSDIDVYRYDN